MLATKTNEIIKEVNEMKDIFMKSLSLDMLEDMDEDGFIAMKKCFKLMNLSMELAVEQAQVMDEINAKLDKLVAYIDWEGSK